MIIKGAELLSRIYFGECSNCVFYKVCENNILIYDYCWMSITKIGDRLNEINKILEKIYGKN